MTSDGITFYEHSDYSEQAPYWRMYRDLFEGKHSVLRHGEYLWYHELETGTTPDAVALRGIREQRSRYLNFIEPVISRFTSLFFKDEPQLDDATKRLFGGDDQVGVTDNGKSFASFIKEDILQAILLYGRPIVLTDAPAEKPANLGEQQRTNFLPRFQVINPLDFKDWEFDTAPARVGKFKACRWEYFVIEPRSSLQEEPKKVLYTRVMTWKETGYVVETYRVRNMEEVKRQATAQSDSQSQAKDVQARRAGGYEWELVGSPVPVPNEDLPVRSVEGGVSWIKDVSQQQLKLFNLESVRDSIHLYQAHQRTFFIGVGNDDLKKALGMYTICFLPKDGDVKTLEPCDTSSIDNNIEATKVNLFRIAFNQDRGVSADSKQVAAADSQQEAKEQLVELIKSELETVETFVNLLVKDYAFFKGETNFSGKVTLNKDIKVDDVDRQIKLFLSLRDEIAQRPIWHKATLKKLATAQHLENEDEVLAEIEASETVDPNAVENQDDPLKEHFGDGSSKNPKQSDPAGGRDRSAGSSVQQKPGAVSK